MTTGPKSIQSTPRKKRLLIITARTSSQKSKASQTSKGSIKLTKTWANTELIWSSTTRTTLSRNPNQNRRGGIQNPWKTRPSTQSAYSSRWFRRLSIRIVTGCSQTSLLLFSPQIIIKETKCKIMIMPLKMLMTRLFKIKISTSRRWACTAIPKCRQRGLPSKR